MTRVGSQSHRKEMMCIILLEYSSVPSVQSKSIGDSMEQLKTAIRDVGQCVAVLVLFRNIH